MKRIVIASSLIALAALATGCNRDGTGGTAYNNSGASATSPSSTTAPSSTTTTSTATADTSSPNTAATNNMAPGSATGAMSETLTTGKVKAAIAADASLKDSDISVTTHNGVVTLSGTVKSQDQVAIATNLAQKQEGVTRVDTQIAVR